MRLGQVVATEVDLQEVLERLADGELLAEIAQDIGVKRTTLYMQFDRGGDELRDSYARAREEGLMVRAERLRQLASADMPRTPSGSVDSAAVNQLRLRVDTEKWLLSKLVPRVFGDRTTLAGDPDAPLTGSDDQLLARAAAIMASAKREGSDE